MGISVRKGYLREETDSLRSIARIVRERGFSPLFLNHSFHPGNPETDDREFVARLAEEEGMASTDSLSASLDAYRSLDAVIAMRLHAGVLSFVNGIPFFLLSYSKKTDAFAERVGSPWILAASEFDETAFSEAFDRFITEYGESRVPFFALKEKYGRIREETRNSFDDTFYGLESAEK
ncbi:MAG: pyruv trans protein [Patescibacteria group bacterium]|nr:pyruv trans protein [Patescibacteria group bacterium]